MAPSPQAMLIIKISTSSFFTCTFGFPVLERERKENNFQVGFWLRVGGLSCGSGHSHLTQCAWLSPGYSASIQLPAINTLLVGQQGPTGTLRLAGEPLPSNSALASLQEPSLTTTSQEYLLPPFSCSSWLQGTPWSPPSVHIYCFLQNWAAFQQLTEGIKLCPSHLHILQWHTVAISIFQTKYLHSTELEKVHFY